jgi:hypothetical protein
MAPVEQIHPEDDVARLDQSVIDGVVGRRAREGLDVDEEVVRRLAVGGEQLGTAAPRQSLDGVGVFHPLVVARIGIAPVVGQPHLVVEDLRLVEAARLVVGIPLGIDVLKGGGQRLADGKRRGAFGGNQDQLARLPLGFNPAEVFDLGIELRERAAEEMIWHAPSKKKSVAPEMSDKSFYGREEGRSRKEVSRETG